MFHGPLKVGLSLLLGSLILAETGLAVAQQYVPPRRGSPGRREGAGTRGSCIQGTKNLVALMPVDGFAMAATVQPILFWYVPQTQARTAEFTLLDSNQNPLYSATVPLVSKTPGIIALQLPESLTVEQLGVGKEYVWQFSIICSPDQPSQNPFVEGVFQRIQPDAELTRRLQQASPQSRSSIYAAAGIWHDAIGTLAKQRCAQPNQAALRTSWSNLLQSVKLGNYANESLSAACAVISPVPPGP